MLAQGVALSLKERPEEEIPSARLTFITLVASDFVLSTFKRPGLSVNKVPQVSLISALQRDSL